MYILNYQTIQQKYIQNYSLENIFILLNMDILDYQTVLYSKVCLIK